MITLIIGFNKKEFEARLYINNKIATKLTFEDAAENLISNIDLILAGKNKQQISKAAFLVGPGSFTSIKIICSFFNALRLCIPNIVIIPTKINEAIHSIKGYKECKILMRCNTTIWHCFYRGKWSTINQGNLQQHINGIYTSNENLGGAGELRWPDLLQGIWLYSKKQKSSLEIIPFYGLDFAE